MKTKIIALLIVSALMVAVLLSACGEKPGEAPPDTSVITETTVVLETTADGGTVEKDSEGNKITKDKDGKVIAVEDKDGNTIEVTEYLKTHSWVEGNLNGSGNSGNGSTSSAPDSTNADGEVLEGDLPVIIATVPDVEDQEVIPDV